MAIRGGLDKDAIRPGTCQVFRQRGSGATCTNWEWLTHNDAELQDVGGLISRNGCLGEVSHFPSPGERARHSGRGLPLLSYPPFPRRHSKTQAPYPRRRGTRFIRGGAGAAGRWDDGGRTTRWTRGGAQTHKLRTRRREDSVMHALRYVSASEQ